MPLPTGAKIGHYEVLGAIGAGGMGEVYRAADTRLKRQVAVKVLPSAVALDADRMTRFEREARLLASLDHPNIGAIYGIEDSDGAKALILALIEGPTLADRIAEGALLPDEAIPIARQIAEALEYAHDRGVIHRDLKPANIKVTPDGAVKVLDFGLAKALTDAGEEAHVSPATSPTFSPTLSIRATQAGMILGTAAYMAPEQAKGKLVDRRADIWAFGAVLYEMLTGSAPFGGESAAEIMASTLKEEPKLDRLPGATPPAVRQLIARCLHKDPKQRLQAIGEARIVLSGPMEEAAPPGARGPVAAPTASRSGRLGWLLAGVMALVAAGVAFLHLQETPPAALRAQFQLAVEGTRLGGWQLSPDGRALAFSSDSLTQRVIRIRFLDSLQARQLPGTEGGTYPFWSPDGEYLAFFAEGKLKKVAVAGGPPQVLCDAPTGRGGSWNRDGVIVFAPTVSGGIYRVSANGGTPQQIVKIGRFPEFIHGGKRFLFASGDGTGTFAGSVDGSAPARVLEDNSRALYVPPPARDRSGHLLFRRGTTLMAQRFDPERLALEGNPIPLAERIGNSGNVAYGGFAASENGVLLIAEDDRLEAPTRMTWLDRSGKAVEVTGEARPYAGLALAPNGKRIATAVAGNTLDIWLEDVHQGAPTRFTFSGNARQPTWSPRGDFLIFATRALQADFYRKASNGEGKEELFFHAGSNANPNDISGDGKWLVFAEEGDKTKDDLWLLPLEGERKAQTYLQTPFNERNAQFSPDGKWMAYTSDESSLYQVYVQPIPATGAKRQVSMKGGSSPRWRRDGAELFYISSEGALMAATVTHGVSGIEFGAPRQLFERRLVFGNREFLYQPAADGQKFLAPLLEDAGNAPARVIIQMNWQAGLKSRN